MYGKISTTFIIYVIERYEILQMGHFGEIQNVNSSNRVQESLHIMEGKWWSDYLGLTQTNTEDRAI